MGCAAEWFLVRQDRTIEDELIAKINQSIEDDHNDRTSQLYCAKLTTDEELWRVAQDAPKGRDTHKLVHTLGPTTHEERNPARCTGLASPGNGPGSHINFALDPGNNFHTVTSAWKRLSDHASNSAPGALSNLPKSPNNPSRCEGFGKPQC